MDIFNELSWRGLINQTTDDVYLQRMLKREAARGVRGFRSHGR